MNEQTVRPTDLAFATTDELLDELNRRSDGFICAYAPKGKPGVSSSSYTGGHRLVAQGLLMDLKHYIAKCMVALDSSPATTEGDE